MSHSTLLYTLPFLYCTMQGISIAVFAQAGWDSSPPSTRTGPSGTYSGPVADGRPATDAAVTDRLFDSPDLVTSTERSTSQMSGIRNAKVPGLRSLLFFNGMIRRGKLADAWIDGQPLNLWVKVKGVQAVDWDPSSKALVVDLAGGSRHSLIPGQGLYRTPDGGIRVTGP